MNVKIVNEKESCDVKKKVCAHKFVQEENVNNRMKNKIESERHEIYV